MSDNNSQRPESSSPITGNPTKKRQRKREKPLSTNPSGSPKEKQPKGNQNRDSNAAPIPQRQITMTTMGDGSKISSKMESAERETVKDIISEFKCDTIDIITGHKTLLTKDIPRSKKTVRIDRQGKCTQDGYMNIQVQIEDNSHAGIKIRSGINFGPEIIQGALMFSLKEGKMVKLDFQELNP